MKIFILGPSRWRVSSQGRDPEAPSPLELRRDLRRVLWEMGVDGIVMEDEAQKHGETHAALFDRILGLAEAMRVYVLWPAGAVRVGLDVELGMMLQRMVDGKPIDLWLFIEQEAARIDHGRLIGKERGARTRYYEDLVRLGANVVSWSGVENLQNHVRLSVRDDPFMA